MKTILIIDDDSLCRRATGDLLRLEGWRVLEASDGEAGLKEALNHRPDVVLCDLLMPRGNGFQFCRAVREHVNLKHLPLIVLSGRDYPADRQAAFEAGATEYLVKPIRSAALDAALERLVPAATAPPTPVEPPVAPLPKPALPEGGTGTSIKFWGVRGSIPTPGASTLRYGGNTSCVEVRADGELIVLDAGTGMRLLGLSLAEEFKGQPIALTLLVTHTHWDHIQGFPFFTPAYNPQNQLRILGYEGASASLAATLAGQMETPYFPVALDKMPGNLVIEDLREMEFKVGSVPTQAWFSRHPGICVGYRLNTQAGSVVYMPDNEWSLRESEALRQDRACGPEQGLVNFVEGVDVLILDAQYSREEYSSHVGWGHGCVDDVVLLAIKAGVKRLFLFHHDPLHDDAFLDRMLERSWELVREAGSPLIVNIAQEGATIVLAPKPKRSANSK